MVFVELQINLVLKYLRLKDGIILPLLMPMKEPINWLVNNTFPLLFMLPNLLNLKGIPHRVLMSAINLKKDWLGNVNSIVI